MYIVRDLECGVELSSTADSTLLQLSLTSAAVQSMLLPLLPAGGRKHGGSSAGAAVGYTFLALAIIGGGVGGKP